MFLGKNCMAFYEDADSYIITQSDTTAKQQADDNTFKSVCVEESTKTSYSYPSFSTTKYSLIAILK